MACQLVVTIGPHRTVYFFGNGAFLLFCQSAFRWLFAGKEYLCTRTYNRASITTFFELVYLFFYILDIFPTHSGVITFDLIEVFQIILKRSFSYFGLLQQNSRSLNRDHLISFFKSFPSLKNTSIIVHNSYATLIYRLFEISIAQQLCIELP